MRLAQNSTISRILLLPVTGASYHLSALPTPPSVHVHLRARGPLQVTDIHGISIRKVYPHA